MLTWEQAFEQTFYGTLNAAQVLNMNPEALEQDFLDKMVQQGKVAPRVATDTEYKAMVQKILRRWRSGQNQ